MKVLGMTILIISIFLCFGNRGQIVNFAQEKSSENLTSDLEKINVVDNSKKLNQKEREEIVRAFTKSYIETVRQKKSDFISPQTPLYILLKTNFPTIKDREEERGISLGNIVKFLNSNLENREVINSVLIQQKGQKCY